MRNSTLLRTAGVLLAGLVCSPLTAQRNEIVLPVGFDIVEGDLLYTYPFGRTTGASQILMDGSLIGSGMSVVTGIRFRPNGDPTGSGSTGYTKAYVIEMTATPITAATMTTDPVVNRGGATPTTVFNGSLSIPSFTPGSAPQQWSIDIPLQTPFSFDPSQANLLVEVRTADQQPAAGTYRLDATVLRNDRTEGIAEEMTVGCANTFGDTLDVMANESTLIIGGSLDLQLQANRSQAFPAATIFFGLNRQAFDLGPLGLPGCSFEVPSDVSVTVVDAGTGYVPVSAAIPAMPALVGANLLVQAFGQATTGQLANGVTSPVLGLRVGVNGPNPTEMQSIFTRDLQSWFMGRVGGFTPIMRLDGAFQ